MALEAGIVGLQGAGKTTLFNALTRAAVAPGTYEQHVGVAPIDDDRLDRIAPVIGSAKVTPASLRVVDVPGTGAAMLGHLRQVDALLAILDGFSPGADPKADLETLRLELLVADRDHVEKRLDAVRPKARAGDADARVEAVALEGALAHLESERPLSEYGGELAEALEPLTTKPLLAIENGPGGTDCKLEAELAELPDEEAAAFRDGSSALVEVVRGLHDALGLVTFFTANENEARAWTLAGGRTALEAAESIHTDMARGFVRCEVIRWNDLVACGSRAEAARRGLQRLEGKTYVVEDGDVLQIRFTPPRGH